MDRRTYLGGFAGASLACLSGCLDPDRFGGGPTVQAPATAPVDESLDVRVSGVDGEAVWVEARTRDGAGHAWSSRGLFVPEGGRIELQDARPVRGTYDERDGMGLFWSMVPEAFDRELYDDDQRTQSVRLRVVAADGDPAVADGDLAVADGDLAVTDGNLAVTDGNDCEPYEDDEEPNVARDSGVLSTPGCCWARSA